MRIAFCIVGQPRFVEELYPLFENNILIPNKEHQIDVFVHTWFSEEILNKPLYQNVVSSFSGESYIRYDVIDKIEKLYKPKLMTVEEPKKFTRDLKWGGDRDETLNAYKETTLTKEEYKRMRIDMMYSLYYSIAECIKIKKLHELENGFTYDLVIRSRFDNIYRRPIELSGFDGSYIWYQEMGQPHNMVSDWLNIGSSRNIDSLGTIFGNLESLADDALNKYGTFTNESLIRSVCDRMDIPTKGTHFGIELPSWGKINL